MVTAKVRPGESADATLAALAQGSLADRVNEALREQILSGRFAPGQRVDLGYFASKWQVSLTPVRDAAKQLEALGFLKVLPRRGVFVAELAAKEVRDIFDLRCALETAAARLATPRIAKAQAERALKLYVKAGEAPAGKQRDRLLPKVDLLVHTMALQGCDNPRLQKMMEGIRDMVRWCQSTIIARQNEPFLVSLPEHIAICEAIVAGDAERAAAAMRLHIDNTSLRIQAFLRDAG